MTVRRAVSALVAAAVVAGLLPPNRATVPAVPAGPAASNGAAAAVRALVASPLRFEENLGQTDASVAFLARGAGMAAFLTPEEMVVAVDRPGRAPGKRSQHGRAVVTMRLVGANPGPAVTGEQRLPVRTSSFVGDAGSWRTGIPSYERVRYRSVYPGVDLVFHGAGGGLEYDFEVAPAVDPRSITVAFGGARRVRLDSRGHLLIPTASGTLRHERPSVYQRGPRGKEPVAGRFVLRGHDRVGFDVGRYDRSRPLVIDPVLTYATFLGGGSDDRGHGVAVAPDGAVYVVGRTSSASFPRISESGRYAGGDADAFLAKVDPSAGGAASLVSAAYLGGDGFDEATAVAVDAAGDAYVAGTTNSRAHPAITGSTSFPTTEGAFQRERSQAADRDATRTDAFMAKLATAGAGPVGLRYSTYLGGPDDDQHDSASGIAVDASGVAWVSGLTSSRSFPATSGSYDSACGSDGGCDQYEDFFDGRSTEGSTTFMTSARIDSSAVGKAITGDNIPPGATVVGVERRGDYQAIELSSPATGTGTLLRFRIAGLGPLYSDGFLAAIDPASPGSGSLHYATFLGGAGDDGARGVALGPPGPGGARRAYVVGQTQSADFPAQSPPAVPGNRDAFVAVVDARVAGPPGLAYATRYGGRGSDGAHAVAVGAAGNAVVAGETSSDDLPTTAGAAQRRRNGDSDAFVAWFDPARPSGSPVYATYLGGSYDEGANGVAVSAQDGTAVVVGHTSSDDFPLRGQPFQRTRKGPDASLRSPEGRDAFVARIDPSGSGVASLRSSSLLGGSSSDVARAVVTDEAGDAYVTGSTASADLALVGRPPQDQNAGGTDAFVAKVSFTEVPTPLVAGLTPSSGPASGGTPVTLRGSGFTAARAVRFGGVDARSFVVESDTRIQAVTPAHGEGAVLVTVATEAATSPLTASASFVFGDHGIWDAADPLPGIGVAGHTATLLGDGRVLVAGGMDPTYSALCQPGAVLTAAALFDPAKGAWEKTGPLRVARYAHTATLLPDGSVLATGGVGRDGLVLASTEIFSPTTGTWAPGPDLADARFGHTATTVAGGDVVVAGGGGPNPRSTERYHQRRWRTGPALASARHGLTATLLADGSVYLAGGTARPSLDSATAQSEAPVSATAQSELYVPAPDPADDAVRTAPRLRLPRRHHSATRLAEGAVLLAAGITETHLPTTSTELYDHGDPSRSALAGELASGARFGHAATGLPSGAVLVTGGADVGRRAGGPCAPNLATAAAGVYEPSVGHWRQAGAMAVPRGPSRRGDLDTTRTVPGPTATLLSAGPSAFSAGPSCGPHCGKVLVVGGSGDATAELYTPAPSVRSVSPSSGAAVGGDEVVITGTGFTHGVRAVLFGDVAAPRFSVDSYSRITATVPAGVASRVAPVSVVGRAGTGAARPLFSYVGPPGAIDDLVATLVSPTEVELTFSAPGSVAGLAPPATDYVVKQSTTPMSDDASFDRARSLCDGPCRYSPRGVRERLTLSVGDLAAGTTYYFSVRAVGDGGVLGPLPAAATVTTPAPDVAPRLRASGCPPLPVPAPSQVAYPAGYSIVGLPAGTRWPAGSVLYGWFDAGAGGAYSSHRSADPVTAGRAYWAWSPCPRLVDLHRPGTGAMSFPLGALRASLVGNPSATGSVTVTGHDYAARWDPAMNAGAGGYRISGFRQPQTLARGEGIWVFSFRATSIRITG